MKKILIIIGSTIATVLVIGVIVYFVLTKGIFTVTFDSNGGSKVNSVKVLCGSKLTLPNNPTKKGYSFISWVDKNGTPIYDKAKLSCEDITLKATWKKNSTKNSSNNKNNNKNNSTNTPKTDTDTKDKTYSCPSGYTLNSDNKCETSVSATNSCPSNYSYSTKLKLCYSNETNPFERKCKQVTQNGKTYDGELIKGRGSAIYCGYDENKTYYNSQRSCEHANYTYSTINNKCYYIYKSGNTEVVCPTGYYHASSKELSDSQTTQVCVKTSSPSRPCPAGYSLDGDKCYKYVEPTLE